MRLRDLCQCLLFEYQFIWHVSSLREDLHLRNHKRRTSAIMEGYEGHAKAFRDAIGGLGVVLILCSEQDVSIEFVGNDEAEDGITYWAYEIPNVTLSITSNCSTNETNWFSVSNDTTTFYHSILIVDENCTSCECTTINSTTSVSTECVATHNGFIFHATIDDLSSETTNFSVEFTNSTFGLARASAFRNCLLSELRTHFTVTTNTSKENFSHLEGVDVTCSSCTTGNSTIRIVCDYNGEWNVTGVSCDEQCDSLGTSALATAMPVAESTKASDAIADPTTTYQDDSTTSTATSTGISTNFVEAEQMITATTSTGNAEITQDDANESKSSQPTTAPSIGSQLTNGEGDLINTTPSSSLDTEMPHSDVTAPALNATEQPNVTTSSTAIIELETKQLIAVCVVTNVIMVVSCCIMIVFFRHKRNDKRKSRSRLQTS